VHYDIDNGGDPIRAVLVDADGESRRRIRNALQRDGIAVVAEAPSGREAIELVTFYRPDAIVIDANPAEIDGAEVARVIYDRSPSTCIVLLATAPDEAFALKALRAGATGYLPKSTDPDVLPRVLRGALEGEAAISRRLAMTLIQSYRRAPRIGHGLRPVRSELTDREWEVLDLLSIGARTEEIARMLVLSTETVRSHLKNLYRKLGVRSRQEAIEAAERLREPVI